MGVGVGGPEDTPTNQYDQHYEDEGLDCGEGREPDYSGSSSDEEDDDMIEDQGEGEGAEDYQMLIAGAG
jgi:hypothetical protein